MENAHVESITSETREIRLNEPAFASLNEMRKWTLFFAILGIVGVAFMVIIGIVVMVVLPAFNQGMDAPYPTALLGTVYLILGAIYVLPILYLMQFSSRIKKALNFRDENILSDAFNALKLHFRTVGIITIVIISLYLVLFLGLLVFGAGLMSLSGLAV
ncbi:MAG: hypothetical protein FD170_947 [Bacteroidetes bacterium]|nr:MAG: hypothetical protein FD170_947 [Bacteroidota bacterium]